MSAATPAYRLGAHTWRSGDGRLLVGGYPPRRVQLSAAGVAALDDLLTGQPAPGGAGLERRLRDSGLIDPVAGGAVAAVTFVVPVRDGGVALATLVADLVPFGEVIVVDDGSVDGSPQQARRAGARLLPNPGPPGPAAARNVGAELARTELVAFVDADCRVAGDWARPLAALLLADPGLAVIAPRIRGAAEPGRLARWERLHSPLDMGPRGGLVGPGRRISFVPAAALVGRRSALLELGGFDPTLRFGEDVDLVWRAVAAGLRVRYAPEIEVEHPARSTVCARARQHFEYGTSAAALERRHPGAAAPLRLSRLTLPPALLGAGAPATSALAAGAIALRAVRGLGDRDGRAAIARLLLDAQLETGRQLARALSRDWLPLTVAASTRRGRPRRLALSALLADLAVGFVDDPTGAPTNLPLRIVDNAAYAAGLWCGASAQKSVGALLPRQGPPPAPSNGA